MLQLYDYQSQKYSDIFRNKENIEVKENKFMAFVAAIFGGLLILLGLVGYMQPELMGTVGEKGTSVTALIPAFFGGIIEICGLLTIMKPNLRKHTMHAAAAIGLLGFLGAVMRPVSKLMKGESLDFNTAAVRSIIIMAVLCLIFVGLCVKSFVDARKARKNTPTN